MDVLKLFSRKLNYNIVVIGQYREYRRMFFSFQQSEVPRKASAIAIKLQSTPHCTLKTTEVE